MFLVRISNELQIATFNRQLSDLIGQYSAINLMGGFMDDQSLIGDGKTVIEMISDQVPNLIGDQFDQPSNVHGKIGPKPPETRQWLWQSKCNLHFAADSTLGGTHEISHWMARRIGILPSTATLKYWDWDVTILRIQDPRKWPGSRDGNPYICISTAYTSLRETGSSFILLGHNGAV